MRQTPTPVSGRIRCKIVIFTAALAGLLIESAYARNFVEKGKNLCPDHHIEPGSEFGFQELDETEFPTLDQGNSGTCSHHSSLQVLQYLYHHFSPEKPKVKERFSIFPVFCDEVFEEGGLAHANLYHLRTQGCLTRATETELRDWKRILEQAKVLKDKICKIPFADMCVGELPHSISEGEVRAHYEAHSEPTRSGKINYSAIVKSVCSKDERDRVPLPLYNIHVVDIGPEMRARTLADKKGYFLEIANRMLGKSQPITPMVVSFCTESKGSGSAEECTPGKRHGTTLIGSRRSCCGSTCVNEWLVQDSGGMSGWNNADLLAESMARFGGSLTYVKNCGGKDQEACTPDIQGPYPLHYLIEAKDLPAAKRLLHSMGSDRERLASTLFMKNAYGRTPAHLAVSHRDIALVRMTSAAGLVEDDEMKTPIQRAIALGRTELLDGFLSNPEIKERFFRTEFDRLVSCGRPYSELLHPTKKVQRDEVEEDEGTGPGKATRRTVEIVDTGIKDDFAKSLAHILKMEETRKLLRSPEKMRELDVLISWLPLWATQGEYTDVLQELANLGHPTLFSQLDRHRRSLLDWAVQNGDLPSVRVLLSIESGKSTLRIADDSGNTPFHWFNFGGGSKPIELLREMASQIDPVEEMFLARNHERMTPIQQTYGNCQELVAFLSVLLEQRSRISPIHFAEIAGTLTEKIRDGKSIVDTIPITNCKASIPLFRQVALDVPDLPELSQPRRSLRKNTLHLAPAHSSGEE